MPSTSSSTVLRQHKRIRRGTCWHWVLSRRRRPRLGEHHRPVNRCTHSKQWCRTTWQRKAGLACQVNSRARASSLCQLPLDLNSHLISLEASVRQLQGRQGRRKFPAPTRTCQVTLAAHRACRTTTARSLRGHLSALRITEKT